MHSYLPLLRILITIIILGCSCITDWKERRASNRLWLLLGGTGLLFDLYAFLANGMDAAFVFRLCAGVLFIYVLVYAIFRAGGFGGADAKALIAIAIMFPLYPSFEIAGMGFPVIDTILSPVFALTVMGNAIVMTAVVPAVLLAYNLLTVPVTELVSNPVCAVAGCKADTGNLKGRHLRLMHNYSEYDDRVERRMALKGRAIDDTTAATLSKWHSQGMIEGRVWVTPGLPFLIPITLGFLTGILYGDILMQAISLLL